MRSVIMPRIESGYMTRMQYAEGLYVKSRQNFDVRNNFTLTETSIEKTDPSIC